MTPNTTPLSAAILATRDSGKFVQGGVLDHPDFRRADLSGLRVEDPVWTCADFSEADLADFRCMSGDFSKSQWQGAALDEAMMMDTILSGGTFDHVLFRRAMLTACELRDASLVGVDLTGSTLTGAIFAQADLTDAVLRQVQAKGASFRGARLVRTDFRGANLTGADFRGATVQDARFDGAQLDAVIADPELAEYFIETQRRPVS